MNIVRAAFEEFRAAHAVRLVMHTLFANFHQAAVVYANEMERQQGRGTRR